MSQETAAYDVSADGTITVPSFRLPVSAALSPETAARQVAALTQGAGFAMADLDAIDTDEAYHAAIDAFRAGLDEMFARPLSEKLAEAFPVDIAQARIAGVPVEAFTPRQGRDEGRVLINLHGGAFYSGATYVARIESIPMSHVGGFRVVSVDYRQGYEHKYPAASEDVCAVYRELLKAYPAERIGVYGGSAGGALTLQATAWILSQGLPAPGAIGVFGAGACGAGDGDYFAAIASRQAPPSSPFSSIRGTKRGYLSEVDKDDPLVNPNAADEAFRARFPPCLLITGTRAFDLSPAIASHRALSQAGVEASLHVFDGVGHCFYYDATLPEGADAYRTMVRFFRKHLAG
jgi:acetyl esterase/lipase